MRLLKHSIFNGCARRQNKKGALAVYILEKFCTDGKNCTILG
jgi:hypothetical protein